MSDRTGGQVESVYAEKRVFHPVEGFVKKAYLKISVIILNY